jgi:hypothetical protein
VPLLGRLVAPLGLPRLLGRKGLDPRRAPERQEAARGPPVPQRSLARAERWAAIPATGWWCGV